MSPKKIPLEIKKIFKEDQINENGTKQQQNNDQQNSEQFSSVEESESQQENNQAEEPQDYQQLDDLITHLNQLDHSEDEGIQDYKIGGYHPCHVGQVLANRYVLVQKLGWGHFSTVWLAKDFKYGNYAALKIMKSSPHYLEASYDEVEILQKVAKNAYHPEWIKSLKQYEPNKQVFDRDDSHVLNLLNSFLYKGPYGNHFCMVFEILGVNLLEVLKRYDYKGLPLHLVKQIARQVLMGLDFLNRICRVIHTDLKPQNVLLCLTDAEIKKIVEDGQLASKELYEDRLNLYRHKYHLGPDKLVEQSEEKKETVEEKKVEKPIQKEKKQEEANEQSQHGTELDESSIMNIDQRLNEINIKLERKDLTKNQRRDLKKKLKRYTEKKEAAILEEQKQKERKIKEKEKEKLKAEKKAQHKKEKTAKQLFSAFNPKLVLDKGPKLEEGFKVKIADLGNACWQHHHFATEIQTRQYRSPQVLMGSKYTLSADMWSLACMTFEMLTGELLFNPRKDTSDQFGKNDDHLAQMMELLGRFPKKMTQRGVKARKYFTREGSLTRIPKLQNWSIRDVMIAKYKFTEDQAQLFENFMSPMLNCYPEDRTLAHEMLKHPWLRSSTPQNYFLDAQVHAKLKQQRYDLQQPKQEYHQYESQAEDGSLEDNNQKANNSDEGEDQFFGYEKVGDIRYIDRSWMDLGYIGYGDGIFLDKLDFGPNWQFTS